MSGCPVETRSQAWQLQPRRWQSPGGYRAHVLLAGRTATDSPRAQTPGGAARLASARREKRREGVGWRKPARAWGEGKTLKGAGRARKSLRGRQRPQGRRHQAQLAARLGRHLGGPLKGRRRAVTSGEQTPREAGEPQRRSREGRGTPTDEAAETFEGDKGLSDGGLRSMRKAPAALRACSQYGKRELGPDRA